MFKSLSSDRFASIDSDIAASDSAFPQSQILCATRMKPIPVEAPRSPRQRFQRNAPYMLSALVLTILIFVLDKWSAHNSINLGPNASAFPTTLRMDYSKTIINGSNKPVIYRLDMTAHKDKNERQRKILGFWKTLWANAGWLPEALNIREGTEHYEFADILKSLDAVELDQEQRRHIMKYIAMAGVGGGWLSHSDVFPLHPFVRDGLELPNNGMLTFYDDTNTPSCLLSGSAQEWLRVGRLMIEHAASYGGNNPWTEEQALQDLFMNNQVVRRSDVFTSSDSNNQLWYSDDCAKTSDKRAVHFSLDQHWKERSDDMVIKWLGMWLKTCERSAHFEMRNSA
mmetsp:Transcript_14341/g.22387  ORF Transcript_14341/g.22387 Transcript_14341/m.22387 type:complete len:340 (+) Transcript_14341:75-1094(+)